MTPETHKETCVNPQKNKPLLLSDLHKKWNVSKNSSVTFIHTLLQKLVEQFAICSMHMDKYKYRHSENER
jgi:hypothetical protein